MRTLTVTTFVLLLTSCTGILDCVYDEMPVEETVTEGFHNTDATGQMVLQLDATSYDEWIYVSLHTQRIERRPILRTLTGEWDGHSGLTYQLVEGSNYTALSIMPTDAQEDAEEWDFAIHHFDVKTNGGAVAVEGDANFVADEWSDNQVIVDMREMMGYKIGYQNSLVNRCLCSWLTMDISCPPPTYSASGHTYILKMKDGTKASLRLRDYMNEKGVKGHLTIDISYPI